MQDSDKCRVWTMRFKGRMDVYAKQRIAKTEEGKEVRNFYPVCDNFWSQHCHIKTKDGIQCSECKIKQYAPITDDSVIKHIRGDEQHGIFVLQPGEDGQGGVVDFFAVDFDFKVGRESKGHTFEDVCKYTKCLQTYQIPYGIARSTNNGFHVYTFLTGPCDAAKVRALVDAMFEQAGFKEEVRMNVRPAPEIFPKQSYAASNGVGNSIKPPMIERNWDRERNCFVDDNNVMIPIVEQWNFLNNIPRIDPTQIDKIIADLEIDVSVWVDAAVNSKRGGANTEPTGRPYNFDKEGNFVSKSSASFHKVIEGCKALKQITEDCISGKPLGHWTGFGLLHIAINTKDGYPWFMEHSGWGKTQQEMNQIKQSLAKSYSPWTCKKLQEHGVCTPGTKCLEKRPPQGVYRDGELVDGSDTPPEQWPDPSPIRFGLGKGEAYLCSLLKDCDDLLLIQDEEKRKDAAGKLITASLVFDERQQETIKDRLEKNKVFKKSQINKQFKVAAELKVKEEVKAERSRSDIININGDIYRRTVNPYGYIAISPGKEGDVSKIVCNFVVDILEQRTLIEENRRTTHYVGKFRNTEVEIDFEIAACDFDSNVEFSKKLSQICGVWWNVLKHNVDIVRTVALGCAPLDLPGKPAFKKTQLYSSQGWYKGTYLMPSVAIDKDGIRPNTESPINVNKASFARYLDFKILGDDRFRDVLSHIKADFFNAFPKESVYLGLGLALGAGIRHHLDFEQKPTLWFEGETGSGKSALCRHLARFWGNFPGSLTWDTTYGSMLKAGAEFKDALLWVDDYKVKILGDKGVMVCKKTIQAAYDLFSARGTLSKDGTQKDIVTSHCNYLTNGEETPSNEASVIARMTLLDYPKFDTTITKDRYDECLRMSKDYNGITPRFIHYMLNKEKVELIDEYKDIEKRMRIGMKITQNPDRICYNITFAYFHVKHFIEMMEMYGVYGRDEVVILKKELWDLTIHARDYMSTRCLEEKNSSAFTSMLADLLATGKVHIEGFNFGSLEPYSEKIGTIDPSDPNRVFIFVNTVMICMKKCLDKEVTMHVSAISAQLKTAGILIPNGEQNSYVKKYKGISLRVWNLDLVKAGIKAHDNVLPLRNIEKLGSVNTDGVV